MVDRVPLLAALACAAAGVAACGDSENGGDRLDRAEFTKRADAICEQANREHPIPPPPSNVVEAREQAEAELVIWQNLHGRLKQLRPPENLDEHWDDYLFRSDGVEDAVALQASMAEKDFPEYQRATFELNRLNIERGRLATRLGLDVCSQPKGSEQPVGDEDLVREADVACRQANDALLDALRRSSGSPRLAELSRFYAASFPAAQESLDTLKAIDPPESEAAEWERFLEAYEDRLAITARQKKAADARDQAAFRSAGRDDSEALGREARAALKLGLTVCGANGSAGV